MQFDAPMVSCITHYLTSVSEAPGLCVGDGGEQRWDTSGNHPVFLHVHLLRSSGHPQRFSDGSIALTMEMSQHIEDEWSISVSCDAGRATCS